MPSENAKKSVLSLGALVCRFANHARLRAPGRVDGKHLGSGRYGGISLDREEDLSLDVRPGFTV